jgi:PAS domain S-box-containing protein
MQWHTSNGTLQRRRVLGEPTSWVGAAGLTVAVAVAYALAARLGLALLTAPDGVAVFWPAAGISAGILIALGPKARLPVAAGVMVATVAANLLGDRNLASTAIFAVCNAAEALLIAELTRRFFGSDFRLESLRSVAGLLVATAIATSLSGIGGTAGFLLFQGSGGSPLTIWQHWVASDALGVVIVAPLVVGLVQTVNDPPSRQEAMEGGATLAVLTLASILGFSSAGDYGLTILFFALLFPILLWPAAHCRPACAAAAVFVLGLVVILSMTFNVGHLSDPDVPFGSRVRAVQAALLAISTCTLAIAALFAEGRQKEAEMKDTNDRLQLALDSAELGVWSVDLETGRFENDARDKRIHGHDERAVPQTLSQARSFVNPEDLPRLDALFASSGSTGSSYGTEYRLVSPADGPDAKEERWVAVEGVVVRADDGRPLALQGVTRDITGIKQTQARLQDSERTFRELLAALPAAIYVTDADGRITYCNQSAINLWGRSPRLGADRWSDLARFYYADGTPATLGDCPTEIALRQGVSVHGRESILERMDGTRVPIVPYPTPLRDATGAVVGVVNMTVDISDRKQAEQALIERNTQLTLAGKAGLVGTYAYEPDMERVKISEGYAVIHGLPEGTIETTRSAWKARVHPDDIARMEEFRTKTFEDRGGEYNVEYRILRPGGELRWIESRSFLTYTSDGRPHQVIGVNIDITERKQTEALLNESKVRLADALAAGQVIAFEWDALTRRTQRSDSAHPILGCVDGSRFLKQVHADDRAHFKAQIRSLSPVNPSYALSFRFVCPDGRQIWLEETAKGEFDDKGRLLRVKGLTRDITERKELEDHKNALISELDHRVKNVLAVVSAVASRTQETSTSMDGFVVALNGRIKSMANTHELLSYRRWRGIPLNELVRRELAPYAAANNTQIDGPVVVLSAEAGQALAMVFHELATNAAKFGAVSTRTGRVAVCWCRRPNGQAEDRLCIRWEESGGPTVAEPTRFGYGTRVVRHMVPYELGGTVDLVHAPEGVRCEIELPGRWLSDEVAGDPPSSASTRPGR